MLSKSQTWAVMATLSATVSAEVVSVFQIFPSPAPMGVSIVASDASATTYAMACQTPLPTDEDLANGCSYIAMMTLTQGPEYFGYRTWTVIEELTPPLTVTMDFGCSLAGTTSAACSRGISGIPPESMSMLEAEYDFITDFSTTTIRGEDMPTFAELTVLGTAQPSESSGAKPSGSSGAEESSGGSGRGTAPQSGGSPSPTDGASSPESTGGASMNGWGSASIVGAGMAGALAAIMAL